MTFAEEFAALPPKSRKVALLIPSGMSNRDIANHIGTTENAVKNYLRLVYDLLELSSRLELATRLANARNELSAQGYTVSLP